MRGSSLTQLVHRLNFNKGKRYTQNERKMDRKDSKNEMKDNRERERLRDRDKERYVYMTKILMMRAITRIRILWFTFDCRIT